MTLAPIHTRVNLGEFKLYLRNLGLVSVILGTAGNIKEQICMSFGKKSKVDKERGGH